MATVGVPGFERSERYYDTAGGADAYRHRCMDCDFVLVAVADYEDQGGMHTDNRKLLEAHRAEAH
jgi:hypothetical protein